MFGLITSLVSGVATAISATVSKIGSAVLSFAQKVVPVIAQFLEAFKPIAKALGEIASAFLQGAGILQDGESVSDFGERALQASEKGITPDKYENFEDYMRALREFEIDPNKMHTDTEQIVGGLAVGTLGLEAKTKASHGSLDHIWLWPMVNPSYFTAERMDTLLRSGALVALSTLGAQFMGKQLSGAEAAELRQKLEVNADGTPMNEAQLGDLYGALDAARSEWDKLAEKLQQGSGEGAQ